MPTSTAPRPTAARAAAPAAIARARRSTGRALAVGAVRVLTVLVGLATAWITLGPRTVVVDGMSFTGQWLAAHPTVAGLVDRLGGIEPAGNLFLFVPFASLLALAVGLRYLPVAFLLLACSPFAVEWAQQFLPGRVPDGNDIVRNTTGLLVAFVGVAFVRLVARGLAWSIRDTAR